MKQHYDIRGMRPRAALLLVASVLVLVFGAYISAFAVPKSAQISLKLNAKAKTLYVGSLGPVSSFQLELTNLETDAKSPIKWKSSKPSVVLVDESGLLTPVKKGKANIRLTCIVNGKSYTANCKITVKNVATKSVSFEKMSSVVSVGDRIQLSPTVLPHNAKNKKVRYVSSNKAIATVSSGGMVTTKKPGRVTITCVTKSGNRRFKQQVMVAPGFKNTKYRLFAIGNANYKGDAKLNGCKTDLDLIKQAFINATYSGQKPEVTAKLNLSGAGIRSLLNSMATGTTSKDVTVFYYSGHGMSGGKYNGALCGIDWDMVTVNEVQKALDKVPGKVIVILDCCLSGQYIQSKGTSGIGDLAMFTGAYAEAFSSGVTSPSGGVSEKALTDSKKKAKYKILTACGPHQNSYISQDKAEVHSVFTGYLAEGLGIAQGENTTSLNADKNGDSVVVLSELYAYVDKRVKAYVKRNPTDVQKTMVWPKGDTFPVLARN